jgi:polyribonucleotide nucleotidyltransferase
LAAQNVDDLIKGYTRKRFIVHYDFPPYSVNEIGKMQRQSRREIGHSYLVERALSPVIPSETDFPHSIRLALDTTSSNGSSSMAATCGGSLGLMDAGVPISTHVAGITCGLVTRVNDHTGEIEKYKLMTDISGIEDHLGDMDFKLAGTKHGINACQLDIKFPGLPLHIIQETVDQADVGKMKILEYMSSIMAKHRDTCKPTAPLFGKVSYLRILLYSHDRRLVYLPFYLLMVLLLEVVQINPMLIPTLLGAAGSHLKDIERKTNCEIHVDIEHNSVSIFARSADSMKQSIMMINSLAGEIIQGHEYDVVLTKITDMGIHVRFEDHPGREGFIHITEIFDEPKNQKIEDIYRINDTLRARAIGYDGRGKLLMTLRDYSQIPQSATVFTYINPLGMSPSHEAPKSSKEAKIATIKNIWEKSQGK